MSKVKKQAKKHLVPARSPRRAKPEWWLEFRAALRPGLEQETELMPWLIAETVCDEVSQFLDAELPARYAAWLDAKAERCYSGRRRFHRLMRVRGNAPRAWLYIFMRHWLASILHLERPDLCCRLPREFGNGMPLPHGPQSRLHQMTYIPRFKLVPRDWNAARVTRHHRWAWLARIPSFPDAQRLGAEDVA